MLVSVGRTCYGRFMKPLILGDFAWAIENLLATLWSSELRSASKFVRPDLVVTVTRRHKVDKRRSTREFVLTIGKPNFRGRAFIKACLKAGEPFPVKRVQVKRWGKR